MQIASKITEVSNELAPYRARLVAVSKTHPAEAIQEAYDCGQRIFGENKVQELTDKAEALPKDIQWHMIGHLQRNKVKFIAPFVSLIHSVDSLRLLEEINKQGEKFQRKIPCLLQIHIAKEESKFGFDRKELLDALPFIHKMNWIQIKGLMGMATFTEDHAQVRSEFQELRSIFNELKKDHCSGNIAMEELSMGMSGDYKIALEEGSTLIRIGTTIFGNRNYNNPQ
ncbi:MAG: YggS family pyridoxal phosphate-dependent enzyme [Bacteroidetes bacterium]|nr:YggS family pyridoxal phosphate-dependent enzyme [Bacteroidota bacterium]